MVEKATVTIDGSTGKIVEFRRGDYGVREESDSIRIPATPDSTLLPGFVDAHIHLMGSRHFDAMETITTPPILVALRCVKDLKAILDGGFTTVRDLGSKVAPDLRKAVDEGSIPGPTVYTSGRSMAQTGGDDDLYRLPIDISQRLSYSIYCDGPDECRKTVRLLVRDGANVIKVYASGSLDQALEEGTSIARQFTVDELRAIVDEAHATGLKVAAHAYGEGPMMNALEAGVDSIEHGVGMTDEVCARMAKQGTFYVPTLSVYVALLPRLKSPMKEAIVNHLEKDVPLAKSHGVKVVTGTDFSGADISPHGQNYREIVNVSKLLGVEEALKSATLHGAQCLGMKNSGEIATGKDADLVVVDGDPRKDVLVLRPEKVSVVMKMGAPSKWPS